MTQNPTQSHELPISVLSPPSAAREFRATFALLGITAAVFIVHMLTNSRYGFHRDELQFLSDARHLEWGFVAYPPLTPFLERIAMQIFGLSLIGLRLFSVMAQCLAIFITGLMARELGGGRLAQVAAALCIALSPLSLFEGTEFQYSSFDYLWWVLIAYFVIRLLKSDDPRWCLAIGAAVGIGLLTKYTMAFFVCGILAGLILTGARRFLSSVWFWAGIGLAAVIFLPNLAWLIRHDFVSLHFLQHIHGRDVGQGRSNDFLVGQLLVCTNPATAPVWIAGLIWLMRERRFRMLALMYLVPFALFFFGKGRHYYLGAAYPMLMAAGAVACERWLEARSRIQRRSIEAVFFAALAVCGAYICALVVPLQSSGALMRFALRNNGDLREETGWNELVKTVADVRDSLPAEQRANVGVLVGNYGEQGAIEILGAPYHLPPPISGTNSAWYRSYPKTPPSALIVLGFSQKGAERRFSGCRLAAHFVNPYGVKNEESEDHPDIFVCTGPRQPWPEFWKDFQWFG